MVITNEMVETATLKLLGHTQEWPLEGHWKIERHWTIDQVRDLMRDSLESVLK